MPKKSPQDSTIEIQELRSRLQEAQETLDAIRRGEVDGVVVSTPKGEQVYTLSGAEKPYRLLIEEMREGAVMLSDDNNITYCNRGFAKIVKCPLEKIVGMNIEKLLSPTHKAAFKKLMAKGKTEKKAATKGITFIASDQSLVPTQMSVNSMRIDRTKTTFIVVTNLTEHMEEELKEYTTDLEKAGIALFESEQRWSTTLASIGDAVIATDVNGKITFMNAVSEALTGWTLKEASRRTLQEIFNIINGKTRQEVENPVDKVLAKGLIVGLGNHTILLRRDGKEIPIDDSGAPIRGKDGKVNGVVLIFRDITERKELEEKVEKYTQNLETLVKERTEKLRDAERMAAIGITAGMVGHDIRNPLQAIVGDLFLAKAELSSISDSEKKRSMEESLDAIAENSEYISKIVTDLQDFAKPLNPRIKQTDLKILVEEMLQKNVPPDNVRYEVRVESEARIVMADPDYIKRIMRNLVSNAVQAMPQGGKLKINAFREEETVVLTVEDTGVGIPDEVKGKLFTPLFTTKSKGQGFGLAVVKRLTEALNGTVTFESVQGKGTTFTIRFPSLRETNH